MIQSLCRSARKLQSLALGLATVVSLSTAAWCASPTLIAQPVVTAPASIPELARALKYDAILIYEYVYSNIDYSPIYGVKKGALGALLDGSGNDFDQAALMVALLRQSGYTANYVYGKITLNTTQLNNLFGVDTSTACPVLRLLIQGGFPVSLTNCNVTSFALNLPHVWVQATGGSLGATTYVFDPSFKTYTTKTPSINLASAMGYSQSSFLSLAQSGTTITANSIQAVNSTNIHNALAGYAGNLVNYIRSNIPTAALKDVIGGKYIQPIVQPYTLITSLPYEMSGGYAADMDRRYPESVSHDDGNYDRRYRRHLLRRPDLRPPAEHRL
jgi:hypothetical protein